METIDTSKIRGNWQEWGDIADLGNGRTAQGPIAGGDDTIASIHMVAAKVNEIIYLLRECDIKKK